MRPVQISGFETDRANVSRLLMLAGIAGVAVFIFFGTLRPPKKGRQ